MKLTDLSKLGVPVGVVGIVMLLIVPLPAALLDLLIVVNISLGLVILLTSMYVKKPLEFSIFPSLLLVLTLFRLGLNIASTRLVLSDGYAGEVINAFGHFVVGGSLIIGLVIFFILVVIQFVVITNGAGRVAEVGARFTLDAMPGKQMAIDADLNAGIISEEEARRRRSEVAAEADFYGAMDGASKFVKGDAIAGIIITLINLVGGISIGLLQNGMGFADAIETYSLLSVGDGLVTQIPALLMSVSTGIIVTRSATEEDMGTSTSNQLSQSRIALLIAGVAIMALGLLPSMPKIPFFAIGILLLIAAIQIGAQEKKDKLAEQLKDASERQRPPAEDTPESLIEDMRVSALEVQLSTDLVDLVNTSSEDDLLARIKGLRRKLALELGMVMPPVRTRDSMELPPATYALRVSGVEMARGQLPLGRVLALGDDLDTLPGDATVEPVFGLAGKWVPQEMRFAAELAGATVIDRASVLITHLSWLISTYADKLLSREDVRLLTEGVKAVNPSVVEELIPSILSMGEVQRVLAGLLSEGVSIRDLSRIYEALALRAQSSTQPEHLIEAARLAISPALVSAYAKGGSVKVVTLDPGLEQSLLEALRPGEEGTQLLLPNALLELLLRNYVGVRTQCEEKGHTPALVCAPAIRFALRRTLTLQVPDAVVLSYSEVTRAAQTVESVGVIRQFELVGE